jgi:hypothetical protein
MVAGMFLALGQDPAQVTTSCSACTNYEMNDDGESVNFSVRGIKIDIKVDMNERKGLLGDTWMIYELLIE